MNNQQRKKTGKFLLVAQIPVYLFSIFIFSQLRTAKAPIGPAIDQIGESPSNRLNIDIPEPKRDLPLDKLSLIRKAQKDSMDQARKNRTGDGFLKSYEKGGGQETTGLGGIGKLQEKLEQISTELEKEERSTKVGTRQYGNAYSYEDFEREQKRKGDLERLERMTDDIVSSGDMAAKEELNDVNNTMDKLLQVMEMADAMEHGRPLPNAVTDNGEEATIYRATKAKGEFLDINTSGFNELSDKEDHNIDNSFKASFFNQQTLTSGATVKIKLDEPMLINDVLIGANNFLYGRVNIADDRLVINIRSIRYKDHLFPVSLMVYDYDGQAGIHMPGSLTREKSKQQTSGSVRGMNFDLNTFDQSIETKAITTGSNILKDVFASKIRQVKVTVKPHHQILIKNN